MSHSNPQEFKIIFHCQPNDFTRNHLFTIETSHLEVDVHTEDDARRLADRILDNPKQYLAESSHLEEIDRCRRSDTKYEVDVAS